MNQFSLQNEPPKPHEIRSIQPEFYLQVLHRICIANFVALALVFMVSALFYLTPGLWWSSQGPLGLIFGFVTIEFLAYNLGLAGLLRYRGWYLRTPRIGLNRLTRLTSLVLLWDAIHVLGAFVVFGGFHGPAVVLIPLLCLTAFIILPTQKALAACALLALGLLLIGAAQIAGVVHPLGALGINFTRTPESTPAAMLIVLAALVTATLLGARLHRWLGIPAGAEYTLPMMDTRFGCFTQNTLKQRLGEESQREEEFDSAASFVVVGVEGLDTFVAARGIDAGWQRLIDTSALIARQTRADLDTTAYLGNGQFGLLLPTANASQAATVAQRINSDSAQSSSELHLAVGITEVPKGVSDGKSILRVCVEKALNNYSAI